MIIILISVAAVAGWSYALLQNSKISATKQHAVEQEAIAEYLRAHINSIEASEAEKDAEIRSLKSMVQSLNDKAKAAKKVAKAAAPTMKAEAKTEAAKPAVKKTYKKKSN